MNKVYTVSKYNESEGTSCLISIHKTEEGAKKAMDRLNARKKTELEKKFEFGQSISNWDLPFFYEEETLQD